MFPAHSLPGISLRGPSGTRGRWSLALQSTAWALRRCTDPCRPRTPRCSWSLKTATARYAPTFKKLTSVAHCYGADHLFFVVVVLFVLFFFNNFRCLVHWHLSPLRSAMAFMAPERPSSSPSIQSLRYNILSLLDFVTFFHFWMNIFLQ